MRAQITVPVRHLLEVLPGAGPRVADPVRAAGAGPDGDRAAVDHRAAEVGPVTVVVRAADPAAGERAAGNERVLDSWEHVMPWQVRSEQQCRPVAGGYRVLGRSGAGVPEACRAVGRS